MKYIAFESTFDDLSMSVMDGFSLDNMSTISVSQDMYKTYGGVVPFLSYKEHLRNLPILFSNFDFEIFKNISFVCFAKEPGLKKNISISEQLCLGICRYMEYEHFSSVPIIGVNHIKSHLLACLINNFFKLNDLNDSLFFLVTGAHTSIFRIYVDFFNKKLVYKLLIETIDEAIGSLIDKIARMNGFLHAADMCSKLPDNCVYIDDLPFPNIRNNDFFSFSGLYTHIKKISNLYPVYDFCYTIQKKIFMYLLYRLELIKKTSNVDKVFFAGGVVKNKLFRSMIKDNGYYLSESKFCSDNSAMIGIGGFLEYDGWEIN